MQSIKNATLCAVTSLFPCNVEDTVVVTGSPRSGTTWLSELLRELPGYKMLNEPLHPNSAPNAQRIDGLGWRTDLSEEEEFPELERLLRLAFTGREGATWKWRLKDTSPVRQLLQHATRRKLLVKLLRASRMLPWVTSRFPVRAVVSTFRHPCAVVASQLNAGWQIQHFPEPGRLEDTFGAFPAEIEQRFGHVLSNLKTPAEVRAGVWAIDTYMTLRQPVYRPWIVTTYEDLLERKEVEVRRVFGELGEPVPEGVHKQFNQPSHSAAADLTVSETETQLTKWKDRLNDTQVDTILEVVEAFGLDIYTDDPRPHHDCFRQILDQESETLATHSSSSVCTPSVPNV